MLKINRGACTVPARPVFPQLGDSISSDSIQLGDSLSSDSIQLGDTISSDSIQPGDSISCEELKAKVIGA